MSRDQSLYIIDIFIAFNKIQRYTASFKNASDFLHSELEWDATIRELEIIGEACNSLLKLETIDEKYRRIVDFRNQIIHGYFGIDEEIVWDVITNKLEPFSDDLKKVSYDKNIDLENAIVSAMIENEKNQKVSNFLRLLKKELVD